jgi:hypothetical protein
MPRSIYSIKMVGQNSQLGDVTEYNPPGSPLSDYNRVEPLQGWSQGCY